ncbi:TatD DNase family Scn1 [Trametopsis cervina]|nr:TatD DNase family Scn1 [Trametopsis cervina]
MCQADDSSTVTSSQDLSLPVDVLPHVTDVHCHPTDSPLSTEAMDDLAIRVCAMATRASDQSLVRSLASAYPQTVIPCFGYHPWFTHWISLKPYDSKEAHYRSLFFGPSSQNEEYLKAFEKLLTFLPEPILLDDVLRDLRDNLVAFPNAMLGEVGLDRICRIPYDTPAPTPYMLHDVKREMSPFTIPLEHQVAILEAQLDLAVELRRNVSLHSVKSADATVKLFERMKAKHGDNWTEISVDLHSCTVSPPTLKDIQRKHRNVFMSLSTAINERSPGHRDLIAACPDDRILAESDYPVISRSTPQTWNMILRIAEVKGWNVEQEWVDDTPEENWGTVRKLERNWILFEKGRHTLPPKKKSRNRAPA